MVPAETGFGNYVKWSDAEIESFLDQYPDSVNSAIAAAYYSLAADAAMGALNLKDYDIAVDSRGLYEALMRVADSFKARADEDDENGFQIVKTGDRCGTLQAELAAPFVCRHPWPCDC